MWFTADQKLLPAHVMVKVSSPLYPGNLANSVVLLHNFKSSLSAHTTAIVDEDDVDEQEDVQDTIESSPHPRVSQLQLQGVL